MFIDLAGGCPEACQRAKSTRPPAGSPECESVGATKEGTRAPNDRHPIFKSGSLSAPASVACRAEGAVTSSARLRSVRRLLGRRACIVEDRGLLRSQIGCDERHCRRASVQSVAILHSPDLRPRYPRELLLASDAATVQRLPQPGHRPCPASDAQLMRPSVGKGSASMREVLGAGITFRF